MKKGCIIAIDGPVASGKGTIAHKLAKMLDGFYLYSGAVFRCIALLCLEKGILVSDEQSVNQTIDDIHIELHNDGKVLLNTKDVSQRIQQEDVAAASSTVAAFQSVRHKMNSLMQEIAQKKVGEQTVVVAEGRDIATTVFPNARYKIFLTASLKVRARRRLAQIKQKGQQEMLEQVLADTRQRDKQDSERAISPLSREPIKDGYTVIDSSNLTEQETLERILDIVRQGYD